MLLNPDSTNYNNYPRFIRELNILSSISFKFQVNVSSNIITIVNNMYNRSFLIILKKIHP